MVARVDSVSGRAGSVALRMAMVERLQRQGIVNSGRVAEAMAAVPRHLFVPGADLELAYGSGPVVTHRDGAGVAVSSASAPGTVAAMLEQAAVRPGDRVLEVGSGTGYNAALLSHLVGPGGAVTTIEYDADVAGAAGRALAQVVGDSVTLVHGDGMLGVPALAPYEVIMVTAGAWDLPPAWWEQLAEGGRLVVPLRLRGLTRVIAFERNGAVLRSRSVRESGFIPMKGIGAVAERNVKIGSGPDLVVRVDDGQEVDATALGECLVHSPTLMWTGVSWFVFDSLDFWLASLPGYCRLLLSADAVREGRLVAPMYAWGSMGAVNGDTLAYLMIRPVGPAEAGQSPRYELGICSYGVRSVALAERLAGRVRDWEQDGGPHREIVVQAHPIGTEVGSAALLVVNKQHTRVVVRAE